MRHCWELQEGHNSKDVIDKYEREEREQEWHKAHELVADNLFADIVANEAIDHFA